MSINGLCQPIDTIKIYFQNNRYNLDQKSKDILDSIAYSLIKPKQKLLILGYTDYVGSDRSNSILSSNRANAVKNYLETNYSLNSQVRLCIGRGKKNSEPGIDRRGRASNRIVDLILLDPDANEVNTTVSKESNLNPNQGKQFKGKFNKWDWKDDDAAPSGVIDYFKADNIAYAEDYSKGPITVVNGTVIYQSVGSDKQKLLNEVRKNRSGYSFSYVAFELAMIYGLEDQKDSVFYFLNAALDACNSKQNECKEIWSPNILGFYQFEKFVKANDWKLFESRIISEFSKHNDLRNLPLALKLIIAGGADQSVRIGLSNSPNQLRDKMKRVDSSNRILINEIVLKHGYPKISEVGEAGSEAAFLLVQHSSKADTNFQKLVLNQMLKLVPGNEVNKEFVALLTDRLMVNTSGNQLYGTQYKSIHGGAGSYKTTDLFPIVDVDHVNDRRREMGLPPLMP